MKKHIIYSILFVVLSLSAMAQNKVTGTVTDAKDNSPLPGVSVTIKGGQGGAQTDVNGKYTLDVPNTNTTLVFSYVGYTSQEINLGGKTTLDVKLAAEAKAVSEVVVIGYGTAKRSDLTGAVATLKSEQINDKPTPKIPKA